MSIQPIITSMLDNDIYKLHMQQAVFHQYPSKKMKAKLICRNKNEDLSFLINDIKKQINFMSNISLTSTEEDYLKSLGFYQDDFLNYLRKFKFKPADISLTTKNNQLELTYHGNWLDLILWEVPLLAIISELRNKYLYPFIRSEDAVDYLEKKIKNLKESSNHSSIFNLVDFGTRRRFSKSVHEKIIKTLKSHFPNFNSTSNVALAKKFSLNPVGTQAHEWFQAHQQISKKLSDFQVLALNKWTLEYPQNLKIALTDTINLKSFLKDFDYDLANQYDGVRHDSGDPFVWASKIISHYAKLGINCKEKTLVFSDSLTFKKAQSLHEEFSDFINVIFGIGTSLTCDIPGVEPANIVIKLETFQNRPVAKISDEPVKSVCPDREFLKEIKKTFNIG